MKRLLLFFSLCCYAFQAAAQSDDPINNGLPKYSGTSTPGNSQGGSGIVNVDHFTGKASVNIPIYDYTIDGVDLGVSAGYNTSGIRVDQVASEIGLGWNLNAGGEIRRRVHGIEDDQILPGLGYNNGYSTTIPPYHGKLASCYGDLSGQCEEDKEHDEYEATFAGQSVRFTLPNSFSIDGSGGMGLVTHTDPMRRLLVRLLFIDSLENEEAFSLYQQNAPVFKHQSKNPKSMGFEIVDETGNSFFFKRGDYTEKYYSVPGVVYDPNHTSPSSIYEYKYYPTDRWVLYKIVTQSGAVVRYRYTDYENVAYRSGRDESINEFTINYSDNYTNQVSELRVVTDSFVIWYGGVKQLDRIEYPNGTNVRLMGGQGGKRRCDNLTLAAIDSIVVVSGYGATDSNRLSYRFNYSYRLAYGDGRSENSNLAGSPSSMTSANYSSPCNDIFNNVYSGLSFVLGMKMDRFIRLRLNSIDLLNANQSRSERLYTFTYNDAVQLPDRMNIAQDHYGYHNGKFAGSSNFVYSGNTSSADYQPDLKYSAVPRHTFLHDGNTITYGADKMSDTFYAAASNLTAIENGKKGRIEFYYKPHVLSNPWNGYKMDNSLYSTPTDMECRDVNDGLCIDRIVYQDGYQYDNTVTEKYSYSNGIRFFQGGYYWNRIMSESFDDAVEYPGIVNKVYRNANVQPQDYPNGSNHGYSNVSVQKFNASGGLMQTTKYAFTNLVNPNGVSNLHMTYGTVANTHYPIGFYKYRMGQLLEEEAYDFNDILTSKTTIQYPTTYPITADVQQATISQPWYWRYNITGSISKKTDTYPFSLFQSGAWLPTSQTTTNYAGSSSISMTKSFTYDSNANVRTVTWLDSRGSSHTITNTYAYDAPYKYELVLYDELSILLSQRHTLNGMLIGITEQSRQTFNHQVRSLLQSRSSLKLDKARSQYDAIDGFWKEDLRVGLRDTRNNVVERYENVTDTIASIWDTRIGKCIATVSDARYHQIAFCSFEGSFTNLNAADDNKGNWDFNPAQVKRAPSGGLSTAMTGEYFYELPVNAGSVLQDGNSIESRNSIESGKTFILTFWATGTPRVELGDPHYIGTGGPVLTPVQQRQAGAWKLYTVSFTGNGAKVYLRNLTSAAVGVDELRLYPKGSTISTSTFEPLLGPSSRNDNLNNITYFEYDDFGRQVTTRDVDRNVLSVSKSYTQDADN